MLYCTFCRKDQRTVSKLIAGPGVYICDECVRACNLILRGKPAASFLGWDSLSTERLLKTLEPSDLAVHAARDILYEQVDLLRSRGLSWAKIGETLGVSRQAAWERFS